MWPAASPTLFLEQYISRHSADAKMSPLRSRRHVHHTWTLVMDHNSTQIRERANLQNRVFPACMHGPPALPLSLHFRNVGTLYAFELKII